MPHNKRSRIFSALKRRRTHGLIKSNGSWDGVFEHFASDDNDISGSEQEDIPSFKSDISNICERCSAIDFAFMLQRAGKYNRRVSRSYSNTGYGLGSLQEIQARADKCQLCRAWLQLLPEIEGHAESGEAKKSFFSLEPSSWSSKGVLDALEDDYREESLHGVKLNVRDIVTRHKGIEFRITVNGGSLYLNRDDIRWNEPASQVNFSLPRDWLRYCEENHQYCNPTRGNPLERVSSIIRLIDCKRTLSSGELHVIKPHTSPRYVALSYVWGEELDGIPKEQVQLGDKTGIQYRKSRLKRNRLKDLPKVIQDSIWATKKLGIDYLWVDKYCIDQNDTESKHETIMRMDLIYSAARLAIVAAAGSNHSHGLAGAGSTSRKALKSVKVSKDIAFIPIKHAKDSVSESVWATRAWTLQEGLLARRRLVFTPDQIYFECRQMQMAETLEIPLDVLHNARYGPSFEGAYFHGMANHHVEYFRLLWIFRNYTRRHLSYDTDRINAFVGILNSMKPDMSHVWGLSISAAEIVKKSFLRSLGWIHDWKWLQKHNTKLKQQPKFPSWSWAAWEGPQEYNQLEDTEDVLVKFHLNDGSAIDMSEESIRDQLSILERRATHRLTLQTYVLKPESLVKFDGQTHNDYTYRLNKYRCAVQQYLGPEEVEMVLENIRDGTFKLIYVGSLLHAGSRISAEARFIIGRTKGDAMERIGLLKVEFDMDQNQMEYLRLHAEVMSVDLT